MIEINAPEATEFVISKDIFWAAEKTDKDDKCIFALAVAKHQKEYTTVAWQDYNYFSGVVATCRCKYYDSNRGYQILPKSLAVSLARAFDHEAATRKELYDRFKDVVWTLVPWS